MSPVKRSQKEGLSSEDSPTKDKGDKVEKEDGCDSDVNPEDCIEDDEAPDSPSKVVGN
jgi:hypothetical protein